MITSFTIRKPDDFHCHLRQKSQGRIFTTAVKFQSKYFARSVAMGNTVPAITTADDACSYKRDILSVVPAGYNFEPVMTVMLTKRTTPEVVSEAAKQGIRVLKYIPEGVSTNSEESVSLEKLPDYYPVLEAAQDERMVFSGHWESLCDRDGRVLNDMDRETAAIPTLSRTANSFPELRIVVEHASTIEMINYVKSSPPNIGCTLTLHHSLLDYQDVCDNRGRIKNPHYYCKPILKSVRDRMAVREAMTSGNKHFFLGTDTAPHLKSAKGKNPPAAGIFSAPVAVALLAEVFEESCRMSSSPCLEGMKRDMAKFASENGADFYDLPRNTRTITLVKKEWTVPSDYNGIVPLMAGRTLRWQVAE